MGFLVIRRWIDSTTKSSSWRRMTQEEQVWRQQQGQGRHNMSSIPSLLSCVDTTTRTTPKLLHHHSSSSSPYHYCDRHCHSMVTKKTIRQSQQCKGNPYSHVCHFSSLSLSSKNNNNMNDKYQIYSGPSTRFGTGIIANLTKSSIVGTSGNTVILSTVATSNHNNKNNNNNTTDNNDDTWVNKEEENGHSPSLSSLSFQVAMKNAMSSSSTSSGGGTSSLLTVDYRERHHGVGRIPRSNAHRRDNLSIGTDSEILASRAIDRALRPLLISNTNDTEQIHVSCSVQSYPVFDKHNNMTTNRTNGSSGGGHPVALSINSCSAALYQVGLLDQPVGCVHLCLLQDGQTIVMDPIPHQVEEESLFELLYAGTRDGHTTMMECSSKATRQTNNNNQQSQSYHQEYNTTNNDRTTATSSNPDPGMPEETLIELLQIANHAIQPLLDIQYELKQQKDNNNTMPTDSELRISIGLPPLPSDTVSSMEREQPFHNDDNENQLHIMIQQQQQQDTHTAQILYQEAYDFCQERMKESTLRLFGYNPTTTLEWHDENDIVSIHGEDGPSSPLLSKSIRGRREHLVFLEIQRLLQDEFYPTTSTLLQDYKTYILSNTNLLEQMARQIHEGLLQEAMYITCTTTSSSQYPTRGDGRIGCKSIRPVMVHACPALPNHVHGSALFSRGETQVLCTTTLGAPKDGIKLTNPYQDIHDPRQIGSMNNDANNTNDPYRNLPVGSLRFTRNQTALVSDLNTRKSKADKELTGDSGTLDEVKRAFLHYDFPSYSTGEVPGRKGSAANRRAIGHGTLAEKAILPILPPPNAFPYAIRMTSEVTSSNGSSSMATVCGTTLSLCDAGVPIVAPVAGVTVGLVMKDDTANNNNSNSEDHKNDDHASSSSPPPYALLLDITGTEDHYGKMDLKVAGTARGITALQLDGKIPLPMSILEEALLYSREGRCRILESMANQYNASGSRVGGVDSVSYSMEAQQRQQLRPRPQLKDTAPRVDIVRFDATRKSHLIGPGGAVLRQLEERFGVSLDLSQEGACLLFGADAKMVKKARAAIMDLVADVTIGEVYEGTVIEVKDFGAVIELLRNKEGLLHISEWDDKDTAFHVGQKIDVLCTAVDPVQGSINLSRRQLLEQERI